MLEFHSRMETIFENRRVSQMHPGFSDMHAFFMDRNPGALGAMLGKSAELPLPTTVFLDSLKAGLEREDAEALVFRYGTTAEFMGAHHLRVGYDRFGSPWVSMKGESFPNAEVFLDMNFLIGGRTCMVDILSDPILVEKWHRKELEELVYKSTKIKVNETDVYRPHLDNSEIRTQFSRYPFVQQMIDELLIEDEDEQFTKDVEALAADLPGDWSVYHEPTIPPRLQRYLEFYGIFKYMSKVECSVPTLNQMVEETKILVPAVQNAYLAARERFPLDNF